MMNQKLSLSQRGIAHVLAIVIGLGLLAVLAFSLNALFASRSQRGQQAANESQTEGLSPIVDTVQPSAPPTTTTGQPDPTAGWKVATSSEFEFSIRYPPDWYELEGPSKYSGVAGGKWFSYTQDPGGYMNCNVVGVSVYEQLSGFFAGNYWSTPREFFNDLYTRESGKTYHLEAGLNALNIEITKIENTKINSHRAIRLYKRAGPEGEAACLEKALYVLREDKLYVISNSVREDSELYPLAEKMVGSFRFLE